MEPNQNTNNIIKNYKKFFSFVFTYFFLLLALVLAGFFFKRIFINTHVVVTINDAFELQKIKLIGTFEKLLNHTIQDNDVQVYILQWPLLIQNNFMISQDNLISYKWFIVPRNLAIATTLPIKQASYFERANYSTGELAQFVNNFVLITQDNSSLAIKNTQLPLTNGILSTFNLSCLAESILYAGTCGHFLDLFLNEFFVYQLNTDYTGLSWIFSNIRDNDDRWRFCEGMKKYLLYSNDTSTQLATIFEQCGSWYTDFYKRMGFFVDIQSQLDDKYISPDVYKDELLNAYKLLSYQQILYQDFQELKIRKNEYTLYLSYVQELIKRRALPQFYLDELYWYNTYYLKPTLLTTRYDRRWSNIKEWEIAQVIKSIDTINMGDTLSNSSGLMLLVSNPALTKTGENSTPSEILSLQEQISKKIAAITYFIIAQSAINGNTITAQWSFLVNNQKISAKIQLSYVNDTFIVKHIELSDYSELSSVLQWLIETRDSSIGEFFTALSKNLPLYTNITPPVTDVSSLCSTIRTLETGMEIKVATCTQDIVVIVKEMNWVSITYSFLLQNFLPTNITVSDTIIQKAVEDAVKQSNYNPKSLSEAIQFVLSVQPATPIVHTGSTNTLLTLDDFQKYFGINANDIAEKNGVILVDFSIQWVNFIANYDIVKHKINTLYFKDIISNGKPLQIQNFTLLLNTANQSTLDTFSNDPLNYIKQTDLTAWKNYTKK